MLKLINSSYRCIWFATESLCSAYAVRDSHLMPVKSIINTKVSDKKEAVDSKPLPSNGSLASSNSDFLTKDRCRFLFNVKKKLRPKRFPLGSHASVKNNLSMSESERPEIRHGSCGGKFHITANEDRPEDSGLWKKSEGSEQSSLNKSRHSNDSVIPSNFRAWERVNQSTDQVEGSSFKFRVVSYNVLAQYLLECHPYLYRDCSPQSLKWKNRAALLYDEIVQMSPDILCLQEVQASHISSFFSQFEKLGYFGVFKQKTGQRHDGCAIYFKQSVFKMLDHVSVEFYQPELPILNRDNIGMMVKLIPHAVPDSPFVVATTHLLYNPKRTDVRLAQIQVFLAEIDRFAYSNTGSGFGYLPIVITGDLNSTPDSAVIQLLDHGGVCAGPFRDSSDWKKIGVTDNCQHLAVYLGRQRGQAMVDQNMIKIFNSDYCPSEEMQNEDYHQYNEFFNSGNVGHSLQLQSVYKTTKPDGQTEATTFQDYWITVDYIYFSCHSRLNLVERLRLPTSKECEILGLLPNEVYGSDHLALAAVFEIRSVNCSF